MRGLTLLLASVMLLAGAPASAQGPAEPTPTGAMSTRDWARSQGNRIGLETDVFGSSPSPAAARIVGYNESTTVVSFTPMLQLELIPKVYLDAEVPLGLGFPPAGVPFVFGNPMIGAHYTGTEDDRLAYFAGINVSAPTIHDPEYPHSNAAVLLSYSRAFYDVHRFIPQAFSVRARTGVEIKILSFLYYRGDVAPVLYLPTSDSTVSAEFVTEASLESPAATRGSTSFFLEQGNELEARIPLGFGGGLRLQEVFTLTREDLVQLAIEPFLSYEPPAPGLTLRFGFLVALDEELGFGLEQGFNKIATFRFAAGYKF